MQFVETAIFLCVFVFIPLILFRPIKGHDLHFIELVIDSVNQESYGEGYNNFFRIDPMWSLHISAPFYTFPRE